MTYSRTVAAAGRFARLATRRGARLSPANVQWHDGDYGWPYRLVIGRLVAGVSIGCTSRDRSLESSRRPTDLLIFSFSLSPLFYSQDRDLSTCAIQPSVAVDGPRARHSGLITMSAIWRCGNQFVDAS